MAISDLHGLPLSGASYRGADHYFCGLHELRCFIGDPVASADAAIAVDPGFAMAHILKGYLYALSTESDALIVARAIHERVSALPTTAREAGHVMALGRLVAGNWNEAGSVLAGLTSDYPLDALALQAGHQIDFFTGNAPMLRDRITNALAAWDEAMPGFHALLGMQAFGFEEMGEYQRAEQLGRRATELEPRDGWAQHAVAHVMEMQCRQRDGVAWMRANPDNWARDSFLKTHNWWHLALFHFDLDEISEVLSLYDGCIAADGSNLALNLVDASALLWRLHLAGHDVGDRWAELAVRWAPKAGSANYAFNDMHAMMAFVSAGRFDLTRALIEAQKGAIGGLGDTADFTRDICLALTLASMAFGEADDARTLHLIRPVRASAHRFGGSHAQRDVIDLTLIEAAIRSNDARLANALTAERLSVREASPLSHWLVRRAAALKNDT